MDYFVAPVSCGALPVVSHAANFNTGADYHDTIAYTYIYGYEKTQVMPCIKLNILTLSQLLVSLRMFASVRDHLSLVI